MFKSVLLGFFLTLRNYHFILRGYINIHRNNKNADISYKYGIHDISFTI